MAEIYKPINVNFDFKGHKIRNFAIVSSDVAPENPKAGYIYHDKSKNLFRYYDGTEWQSVPYLDGEYRLPIDFIPVLDSSASMDDVSDSTVPTTLLFSNELAKVVPKDYIVTEWEEPPSDDKVASEKLTKDTIDTVQSDLNGKIDDLDAKFSDAVEVLDTKIDEGLESKLDDSQLVTEWQDPVSDSKIASEKLVKDTLDTKLDESDVTETVTASQDKVPSGYAVTMALAKKTDITMAIHQWNAGLTYGLDSTVIASGTIFISQREDNIGNDPLEDTEGIYWKEITGSGGSGNVNGKTIQFGNDVDTQYDLLHNLNTYDFIWSLRTTDVPREYVIARIQAIDKTKVRVILSNPPGTNGLTINLVALKSSVDPITVDVVDILEPSEEWSYSNDTSRPLFIQTYDIDGGQIYGDITQPSVSDFNPAITGFSTPKNGKLVVVKTPYIYEFVDESTWIITHNLGQMVAVQCYTDDVGQITGDFIQSADTCVISFSSPKSGYAVVVVPTLAIEFTDQTDWVVNTGLGRYVAVQTFDETGDQMFGSISQDGTTVTVSFSTPKSGYMLII